MGSGMGGGLLAGRRLLPKRGCWGGAEGGVGGLPRPSSLSSGRYAESCRYPGPGVLGSRDRQRQLPRIGSVRPGHPPAVGTAHARQQQ